MTVRRRTSNPPPLVALEGVSGAGKTTVSRGLAQALHGVRIEEAYWRLHPRPSLEFSSDSELLRIETRLVSEELRRYRDAVRYLEDGRPVVLDTDILGPLTYVWGLGALGKAGPDVLPALVERYRHNLLGERWRLPDLTVYLSVPGRLARRRAALTPRRHPKRWRERHLLVGLQEQRLYLDRLAPILGRAWWLLSATADAPRVVGRIRKRVTAGLTTPAPGMRSAIRLLDAIDSGPLRRAPRVVRSREGSLPGNR